MVSQRMWILYAMAGLLAMVASMQMEALDSTMDKRWGFDSLNQKMADLKQRLKDMSSKLKDKLKDIAEKTANVGNNIVISGTSSGNTQDIWAGHGSILTMNDGGYFVSSSMNSHRVGSPVPVTAVDLTADIAEATCTDVTVVSVKVTVCGGQGRCKNLSTDHSRAKICPGSISISSSSGSHTAFVGDGGMVSGLVLG